MAAFSLHRQKRPPDVGDGLQAIPPSQGEGQMPGYVLIVDFFAVVMAIIGFVMAFRQTFVRRLIGRPASQIRHGNGDQGPLTYVLRIAGVMIMAFGIAIGGMVTLFNLT